MYKIDASVWNVAGSRPIQKGTDGVYNYYTYVSRHSRVMHTGLRLVPFSSAIFV